MKILDIGCGPNKYKSPNPEDKVIGLDIRKLPGVDVVWNLNKLPLPFPDNSFDLVYTSHTLEHLSDPLSLVVDVHRILKPGAVFKIISPHWTNPSSHHIEHKSYFSSKSFDYIDSTHSFLSKLGFELTEKKLRLIRPFGWLEPFINRIPNFYEWRLSAFVPASEVYFTLKKDGNKKHS